METFTIGLGSRWWVRALGRSPLVRRSDRIEAVVLVWAVILTVVAMPVAGAIGTFLHDERTRIYAEEAQTRHHVIATATEDGTIVVHAKSIAFSAEATWDDSGKVHTGTVIWLSRVKTADRQSIWVDAQGEHVGQPSSPSQADNEALGVAVAVWLGIAGASAALVYLIRRWLDRWRYAEWDREIKASRESDGRRNHHHDTKRTHDTDQQQRRSADVDSHNPSRYCGGRGRYGAVESRCRLGGARSVITGPSADARPRDSVIAHASVARGTGSSRAPGVVRAELREWYELKGHEFLRAHGKSPRTRRRHPTAST